VNISNILVCFTSTGSCFFDHIHVDVFKSTDAKNDTNEAMKNHKMGFEVRKLNLGNDHPQVADSLDDVAGLYQKLGDSTKALQCLKEGLRIRRLKSEDSMEISTTLFAMVSV
jgi:hypothetical protein